MVVPVVLITQPVLAEANITEAEKSIIFMAHAHCSKY